MTPDFFLHLASQFGLPVALLSIAVFVLNKNNREAYAKLDAERSQRLDHLERHVAACEADRTKLWERLCGAKRGGLKPFSKATL